MRFAWFRSACTRRREVLHSVLRIPFSRGEARVTISNHCRGFRGEGQRCNVRITDVWPRRQRVVFSRLTSRGMSTTSPDSREIARPAPYMRRVAGRAKYDLQLPGTRQARGQSSARRGRHTTRGHSGHHGGEHREVMRRDDLERKPVRRGRRRRSS